ncbi:hypothetical protein LTR50_007739 [Elasticomyces elasticus]|nr:hypothetical protein LTR50_007739 [Elasticomyces elasticus]
MLQASSELHSLRTAVGDGWGLSWSQGRGRCDDLEGDEQQQRLDGLQRAADALQERYDRLAWDVSLRYPAKKQRLLHRPHMCGGLARGSLLKREVLPEDVVEAGRRPELMEQEEWCSEQMSCCTGLTAFSMDVSSGQEKYECDPQPEGLSESVNAAAGKESSLSSPDQAGLPEDPGSGDSLVSSRSEHSIEGKRPDSLGDWIQWDTRLEVGVVC